MYITIATLKIIFFLLILFVTNTDALPRMKKKIKAAIETDRLRPKIFSHIMSYEFLSHRVIMELKSSKMDSWMFYVKDKKNVEYSEIDSLKAPWKNDDLEGLFEYLMETVSEVYRTSKVAKNQYVGGKFRIPIDVLTHVPIHDDFSMVFENKCEEWINDNDEDLNCPFILQFNPVQEIYKNKVKEAAFICMGVNYDDKILDYSLKMIGELANFRGIVRIDGESAQFLIPNKNLELGTGSLDINDFYGGSYPLGNSEFFTSMFNEFPEECKKAPGYFDTCKQEISGKFQIYLESLHLELDEMKTQLQATTKYHLSGFFSKAFDQKFKLPAIDSEVSIMKIEEWAKTICTAHTKKWECYDALYAWNFLKTFMQEEEESTKTFQIGKMDDNSKLLKGAYLHLLVHSPAKVVKNNLLGLSKNFIVSQRKNYFFP